jgi:hypothetical protein
VGKSVASFSFFLIVSATTAVPLCAAPPPVPADLPRYDIQLKLDTNAHLATFTETITWTNRSSRPTDELRINFYPHYQIPDGDYLLLTKTLELLRLNPRYGIDREGRHGEVSAVHLLASPSGRLPTAVPLAFGFEPDNATALSVKLPGMVGHGQSVTVALDATIRLPNKEGRWGYWEGVSYLTNALPVVAYYDAVGWHAMPFVPWHQPFWNEAGVYTSTITIPAEQTLAMSAGIASEVPEKDGWKTVTTKPFVGRDFAVLASADYREYTSAIVLPDGREIQLKCLAFERHEFFAKEILKIVGEAIPIYSQWFGPFPYDQFTVVESYFGWNGNECAGLIMIDERVFAMPHLGRGYVEYLASHETGHQWWYNLVGTNGYSETFMDEGAVTYFTHRMLDLRHGKNNPIIAWPGSVKYFPDVGRENYRQASYIGAIRRDDAPPAAGDLPTFGHLVGLFSGAYDRGSKVFGMIEARLGEQAFFDFIHMIVKKYGWGMLTADKLKAELETYTGKPWGEFFDQWIYGRGLTDWAVEKVDTKPDVPKGPSVNVFGGAGNPSAPRRVSVIVRQKGALDEPTVLGFQMPNRDGFDIRIPVRQVTQPIRFDEFDATMEPLGDGRVKVELTLPGEPQQITIDPDDILPDADRGNNSWKSSPRLTITPTYTMLNETDLTNDVDRWNFAAGPWMWGASYPDPWYTRSTMVGVRAGAYRTQEFTGGAYAAFRSDYRDAVVGIDGLVDHWPLPKVQFGYNYEQRIGGPYFGEDGQDTAKRAAVFSRYVFQYGSSLYLPPTHYVEGYSSYSDNFLPNARTQTPDAIRPSWILMSGLHYRLNLYTPYWDPEFGILLDFIYGVGGSGLGTTSTVHQFRGEIGAVKKLPDALGWFGNTRIALRGVTMGSTPDRGMFYALGGSTLFRGFDLAERQGSLLWVGNAELRLPLVHDVEWDAFDRVAGVRNIWLAPFYDVGAVYANGRSVDGVAHALGCGFRVDLALFSFIERATVRFDVAKTINANTPFQFWFGVQHPF